MSTTGLDALAEAATVLVRRWLTDGRDRQIARYELTLEATRRPELRAYDLTALLDGLLFDQVAGAGGRRAGTDHLPATIRALLKAVTLPRP